jgi:hypothetical protein
MVLAHDTDRSRSPDDEDSVLGRVALSQPPRQLVVELPSVLVWARNPRLVDTP